MSESGKTIPAALVKELRERTSAGMMECKKYLQKAEGDIELAIDLMRKEGSLKAAKKEGRTTAEGVVVIAGDGKAAVMLEVNCETDFVTRGDDFQQFTNTVVTAALANRTDTIEALSAVALDTGKTVEETRAELIAKIGENINLRRVTLIQSESRASFYVHGGKIGVVVDLSVDNDALGKDIAMHIAATSPLVVDASQVPTQLIEKEKEIYSSQAQESGKPADIIEKMVAGRIKKYLDEVCLLGQPFVKNPDVKIEQLLADANAKVNRFERFVVGEGIEKAADNFVEEVMAQARGE